jgi:hypothetical protein
LIRGFLSSGYSQNVFVVDKVLIEDGSAYFTGTVQNITGQQGTDINRLLLQYGDYKITIYSDKPLSTAQNFHWTREEIDAKYPDQIFWPTDEIKTGVITIEKRCSCDVVKINIPFPIETVSQGIVFRHNIFAVYFARGKKMDMRVPKEIVNMLK